MNISSISSPAFLPLNGQSTGKKHEVDWETNAQRSYLLRPQIKVSAELKFENKLLMLILSMCQNHEAGGRK